MIVSAKYGKDERYGKDAARGSPTMAQMTADETLFFIAGWFQRHNTKLGRELKVSAELS